MTGKASKDQTEYDLETGISAAIEVAFPRLGAAGIKHQIEFNIRLGHATFTAKGVKADHCIFKRISSWEEDHGKFHCGCPLNWKCKYQTGRAQERPRSDHCFHI